MTSAEMFQLFQVLLDKLDTQDVRDVPPEQFFLLVNLATDEYIQEIRKAFEENRKISEDASTLVRRIYIQPVTSEDRVIYSFDTATLSTSVTTPITPIYYLINAFIRSSWKVGDRLVKGTTQISYNQQDDITIRDPFNEPKYADKIPGVIENHSLIVIPPIQLVSGELVGTAIIKPNKINQITPSNLPQQLHTTLVKRAVQLALNIVESPREQTFDN